MSPIADFFVGLGAWNWFFLGIILFVLETMIPGVHLLWFGMAAGVVGLIAISFDISWQWQIVSFGIIAMGTVLWVRRFAQPDIAASDEPDLNVRGQQYVGRIVTVENDIIDGRGRVRIGDTVWAAEGPDLPKGARVKIMGARGTVFTVEPAPN